MAEVHCSVAVIAATGVGIEAGFGLRMTFTLSWSFIDPNTHWSCLAETRSKLSGAPSLPVGPLSRRCL